MKKINFQVYGEIKSKRTGQFNKKTKAFFANNDTGVYENLIKMSFLNAYPEFKDPKKAAELMFKGPVWLTVGIYFSIPKSKSNKDKLNMLMKFILPTKKPDLSNTLKAIEDALKELIFIDDSYICRVDIHKVFNEIPYLDIEIVEMEAKPCQK